MKFPICPKCGNNRQVWENQITGKMTCHRASCGNKEIKTKAVKPKICGKFWHTDQICHGGRIYPRIYSKRETEMLSLLDGVKPIVEIWETKSPAQMQWKREWLKSTTKFIDDYMRMTS